MYHLCLVHKAQGPKGKQRGRASSHPVFWSTGPSPLAQCLVELEEQLQRYAG